MLLVTLLSIRPITSPDIGYHLAYGLEFLDHGQIVDNDRFVYDTLPEREADYPSGPGCWYDEDGNYRFPNANWLSQVAMAGAYGLASESGLCLMQLALILCIFTLMILAMRRLGIGWTWISAGVLLVAMTGYMRFNLRPELFGYLMLAAQFAILCKRPLRWLSVIALIAIQVIFVNLHSYFLLGLCLTAAMLGERILKLAWRKVLNRKAANSDPKSSDMSKLLIAFTGQIAACFINPWGWRLAILPIQTLVFLKTNGIGGGELTDGLAGHPWSYIGEFFSPFAGVFAHTPATYAYCVVLALAGLGGLAALVRRKWAHVAIIAAMVATSLSMRRNIFPAALLITPLALSAMGNLLRPIWQALTDKTRRRPAVVLSTAVLVFSLWISFGVLTQRFYFNQRAEASFGWGFSKLHMPIDASEWINVHAPDGEIWTGYNASSNVHFFTGRNVPLLTNTWAYPPEVMRQVLNVNGGLQSFDELTERRSIATVVLRVDRTTAPLVGKLAADDKWSLGYLDARHVAFVRAGQIHNAKPLTRETLDAAKLIAKLSDSSTPALSLHMGGLTLHHLNWNAPAADLFKAATAKAPNYYEAWNIRGVCLARMGVVRKQQTGSNDLLLEARECFVRSLEIKPGHPTALANLAQVQRDLQ